MSSFVVDFYANPADVPAILEDMEFREVKKKKKKRPRSSGAVRNDSAVTHYQRYGGGGGGGSYGGGSGSGGTVNSGSGMVHNGCPDNGGHSASTSWADLPPLPHHHHHRNTRNSDDVRRKSTGSVPPSEHSSADDSDVESVHSLPVSSTTPRPIVNKTSSSSSCTPQASYADIAKMATASFTVGSTVASSSSSRVLGSSYPIKGFVVLREPEDNPKVVLPNPHVSEGQTMNAAALEETKRDASTWTCSDDHQTVNDDSAPLVIVKPLVDTTLKRRIHNPEMFPTLPYEAEDPQKHVLTLSKCDQDSNCHGRESADCSGSGKQVMSSMVEVSGNRMPPHSEVAVTRNSNADPNAVDHNDQVCTIPNLGTPTPVADVIANSSQEVPSTVDVGGRASSGSVTPTDGTNPEKDPNGDGVMSSLPGVVFIGVLDSMDEELTDVTFGFELNEELLRMTTGGPFLGVGDIILRTGSRDDDGAEDTKLQHDIGVGSFEKKGDLEHKRGRTNNLVDSVAEDDDEEERDEDEEETLSALNADHVPVVEVRVPVSSENPYAEGHEELNSDTSGIVIGPSLVKKPWSCRVQQGDELENCNYNYRNVVEYFGKGKFPWMAQCAKLHSIQRTV